MMRSDDLVPFLTAPPRVSGVSFRQGVIVGWNRETAENTVMVGGTLMTNLPILNTSEAAILAAGDVVGILAAGATWGILGRFTIPGSPEAVSSLSSLRTASDTVTGLDSFTSTTYEYASTNGGPEVTIAVGPSRRLLVFLSAEISAQASAAAGNTTQPGGLMGFELTGANTLGPTRSRSLAVTGNIMTSTSAVTFGTTAGATRHVLLEGLNPGLTTVTAMYAKVLDANQANINNRNITAMAL